MFVIKYKCIKNCITKKINFFRAACINCTRFSKSKPYESLQEGTFGGPSIWSLIHSSNNSNDHCKYLIGRKVTCEKERYFELQKSENC